MHLTVDALRLPLISIVPLRSYDEVLSKFGIAVDSLNTAKYVALIEL